MTKVQLEERQGGTVALSHSHMRLSMHLGWEATWMLC